MPTEKDVLEKKWWWCPKWYWPFAVCSGYRIQHKWCYNFSWVRETGYSFVFHLEGCENAKLYTWTKAGFLIGSTTYPGGELCFNSSLGSDEGRCDSSRTGLLASSLSASEPYASNIDYDSLPLKSTVVETGEFDFGDKSLCQSGVWPWKRTLRETVVIATVIMRFGTIQWFVGGAPVTSTSGIIPVSSFSSWPFPLPKGRNENRIAHIRYELIVESNKSTLKLFNDPADGSYGVSIGMTAWDEGRKYASHYISAYFRGETCDFEPEQVQAMAKCIANIRDRVNQKVKLVPKPSDPIVVFGNGIQPVIRTANKEIVDDLLFIVENTLEDESELHVRAIDQLEQQLGLSSVSRLISITSREQEHAVSAAGQLSGLTRNRFPASLLMLAGGLVVVRVAASLARRLR